MAALAVDAERRGKNRMDRCDIVRIYRTAAGGKEAVGIVETPHNGQRRAFRSAEELWGIVMGRARR
jgi:hypothetical protein